MAALALDAEAVTGTAKRVDQLRIEFIVDFPSETTNQNLENVREGIMILVPHMGGDCRTIDYDVLVRREELEERKLLCRQLDVLPSATDTPPGQINLEVGNFDAARRQCGSATAKCADSREQFAERKWLREVVVASSLQAGYPIVHRIARCEHKYRRRNSTIPDDAAKVESRAAWKHDVQKNYVVVARERERPPGPERGPVRYVDAMFTETCRENRNDLRIVFDQ